MLSFVASSVCWLLAVANLTAQGRPSLIPTSLPGRPGVDAVLARVENGAVQSAVSGLSGGEVAVTLWNGGLQAGFLSVQIPGALCSLSAQRTRYLTVRRGPRR